MPDIRVDIPEAFRELFQPARYKAFHGGRGSAKSHSFGAALLIEAARTPLRILCAREVQKSIKDSVYQLLRDKIAAMKLQDHFSILSNEIRGKNGSQFVFAGLGDMTTDQIKSMEGLDRVWVEEAQTISERSLEILIPTIRKPGSELWFSWNPRNASDPVDQRFRGLVTPENSIIRQVNYDDNRFFPDELRKEMEFDRLAVPDRFAHIWLGDYEPTAIGAIWDRQTLHEGRITKAPTMERIVVAVDPAVTNHSGSDDHGIVVAGIGADQRGYVLDDVTIGGTPRQWAERAIATYDRYSADAVVIEVNQGGDMVRHTLTSIRPELPIIEVRATRGKHVRAEPISALYSLRRISHVGTFTELENQMCQMTAAGYDGTGSPDRCDALVWALTELFPSMVEMKPPVEDFEIDTDWVV